MVVFDYTIITFLFCALVLKSVSLSHYHVVSVMLSRCILFLVFLCCPLLELSYTITRFREFIWIYFHNISFLSCCIIICFTVILSCCLYNAIMLYIIFGYSFLSIIRIILYYNEIPWIHLIILSWLFFGLLYYNLFLCHTIMLYL